MMVHGAITGHVAGSPRAPAGAIPAAVAVGVLALFGACTGCTNSADCSDSHDEHRRIVSESRALMGTQFLIEVVTENRDGALRAIRAAYAEIIRCEEILSNWSDTSQISAVNRAAGTAPVTVSTDLLNVVERALSIAALTGGAFDPTFAACGHLWSVREQRVPTDAEITACLPLVDYRRVALDLDTSAVFLPDSGMQLGLAGLAKGYRLDRAAEVLERRGFGDFMIDGGGDIRLSSKEGPPWTIRIAHPRKANEALGAVRLEGGAIATSGDYQWYFERNGARYHHILDPTNGTPARRALAATVIAPTGVEADALATGLFVMGPVRALALVEALPDVEALLIAPDFTRHISSNFPPLLEPVQDER